MTYDTESEGLDGVTKPFAKPVMMLLFMFSGWIFSNLDIQYIQLPLTFYTKCRNGAFHYILAYSTAILHSSTFEVSVLSS